MRIQIPQLLTIEEVKGHLASKTMSAIGHDGKYFAQASTDPDDKSGYVGIYTFENYAYVLRNILKPIDSEPNDSFGMSMAFSRDLRYLVIGCDYKASYIGAAYVFANSFGVWKQASKLIPADGNIGDQFGLSVAISDDGKTIAVGSPGSVGNYGSVYMFSVYKSQWVLDEKLIYSRLHSNTRRELTELGTFLNLAPNGQAVDAACFCATEKNVYSEVRFIRLENGWVQAGDNTIAAM